MSAGTDYSWMDTLGIWSDSGGGNWGMIIVTSLIVSILVGVVVGLIPLICGIAKKKVGLGSIGIFASIGGSVIVGLFAPCLVGGIPVSALFAPCLVGAVPVSALFTVLVFVTKERGSGYGAYPQQLGGPLFCAGCGAPMELGQIYCGRCGAAQGQAAQPAGSLCPACGSANGPDAVFCGKCGAKLR